MSRQNPSNPCSLKSIPDQILSFNNYGHRPRYEVRVRRFPQGVPEGKVPDEWQSLSSCRSELLYEEPKLVHDAVPLICLRRLAETSICHAVGRVLSNCNRNCRSSGILISAAQWFRPSSNGAIWLLVCQRVNGILGTAHSSCQASSPPFQMSLDSQKEGRVREGE